MKKDYLTITKKHRIEKKIEYKHIYQQKNITELNELIYVGAKIVSEKIGVPLKSIQKKSKPGSQIRLEKQIRNLRKQAKMMKQRKNAGTFWDKKEKATQERITILLEEIHQKVLAKKGRLKRYQQRVKQYRQNGTFRNNEIKF